MKEELKIRSEELELMKRSTKFTKVQELEVNPFLAYLQRRLD